MKQYLLALAVSGAAFAGEPAPMITPTPPPPARMSSESGLFDFVGGELSLGFETDHMRTGHFLGRNFINTAVDVAIPLTEALSLDFGAGYGTTLDNDGIGSRDLDELTASAGLSYDLGAVQVYGGWRWTRYDFAGIAGDLQDNEVYTGVNTSILDGYLNFNAEYYYNLDEEDHNIRTSVSSNIAVTDAFSVVPSVTMGFAIDEGNQVNADNQGIGYVETRLAAPLRLTDSATLTPWIGYTWVLNAIDSDRVNTFGSNQDRLGGGVTLSVQF